MFIKMNKMFIVQMHQTNKMFMFKYNKWSKCSRKIIPEKCNAKNRLMTVKNFKNVHTRIKFCCEKWADLRRVLPLKTCRWMEPKNSHKCFPQFYDKSNFMTMHMIVWHKTNMLRRLIPINILKCCNAIKSV